MSWLEEISGISVSPDYARLNVQLRNKLKHLLEVRDKSDSCSVSVTSKIDYLSAWQEDARIIHLSEKLIPSRHRFGASSMLIDNNIQLANYGLELYSHFISQAAHAKHSRWIYKMGPFEVTPEVALVASVLENIRSELRLIETADDALDIKKWFRKSIHVLISPPEGLDDELINFWVAINAFGRTLDSKYSILTEEELSSKAKIDVLSFFDSRSQYSNFMHIVSNLTKIKDYDSDSIFELSSQILKLFDIPEGVIEESDLEDLGQTGQLADEIMGSSRINSASDYLKDLEAEMGKPSGAESAASTIERLKQQAEMSSADSSDSKSDVDDNSKDSTLDDLWDPDNPDTSNKSKNTKDIDKIKSSNKRISEWNKKIRKKMEELTKALTRHDFYALAKSTAEAQAELKKFKDTKKKQTKKALSSESVEDISHGNAEDVKKDHSIMFEYRDVDSNMRRASRAIKESLTRSSQLISEYTPEARTSPFGSPIASQMMIAQAETDLDLPPSATPWEIGIFEDDDTPEIKVGIILDVTMSMDFAQESLAKLNWCLNNALRGMDNAEFCTALFGQGVYLTQNSKSAVSNSSRYPVWAGRCSSHKYSLAAQCLDSNLKLTDSDNLNEVKVLFVVSDGKLGPEETAMATAENRWLEMNDVEIFWIYYDEGSRYVDSVLNFDNREICFLDLGDIEVSAKRLCAAIDERISDMISDRKVYR